MFERTNCVNCGAPVQLNQCACPWCNTPYTIPQDKMIVTIDGEAFAKNARKLFDIDYNQQKLLRGI